MVNHELPLEHFDAIADGVGGPETERLLLAGEYSRRLLLLRALLDLATAAPALLGALPSADSDLILPPGKTARLLQETTLNFSSRNLPVHIRKMMGFVSQVEFADGKIWVPNRQNLENAVLLKVLPPSAEEQRLTDIYRRRGLDGLVQELSKF